MHLITAVEIRLFKVGQDGRTAKLPGF